MKKIIYFIFLVLVPFLAIALAHSAQAAPRARTIQAKKAIVCGHVYKAESRNFKSTPVIYVVTKDRSYVIYPEFGNSSRDGNFSARLEVLNRLYRMERACVTGTAYNEIFVADSLVNPRAREEAVAAARYQREEQQRALQQSQQAQLRRQATRPSWVPWNRTTSDANP